VRETVPDPIRRAILVAALCALCLAAGGAAGYGLHGPIRAALAPPPPRLPPPVQWEGRPLPPIPQWTLQGSRWDGPRPGRATVLAFWSSSCGTCLAEMAALEDLRDQAGQSFDVAGIPLDRDLDLVACIVARKGIRYPQLRGEPAAAFNPLALTLGVRGVPLFWIVDGKGVVRAGNIARVAELRPRLAALSAE
jgi:hypothetical protein